jgi:hypothetical protein
MSEKLEFYVEDKPDVGKLRMAYEYTLSELDYFFQQTRWSADDRRTHWNGKASDLRKHGANAFPWDGASDIEVPLIAEKINTYVSMCMNALNRSNIRAYPVASDDIARAKVVSGFLKWMVNSYIPRFKEEMEASANYLFEKGLMVTYVGWNREDRSFLQELDLEQIAQMSPELAEAIIGGQDDDAIIEMFTGVFPSLIRKRAKKAMRELRSKGIAQLPVSRRQVDAPMVKAIPADGDVFFPPFTLDPQQAPQVFYRAFMTPQEIKSKVGTEGWDSEWADHVIEHYRGTSSQKMQGQYASLTSNPLSRQDSGDSDFVEVLYVYQRLIDEEDGSEGIYCTVMHPEWTGSPEDGKYAKFELLNGLEDYPFVVTRLSEENRRLYDVQTFSDLLRGIQWQVKTERDQRVDKASLSTLPPIMHPAGRPPQDWGPGRYVPYRRPGELHFGPTPPYTQDSYQIEQVLIQQGDKLIGLDMESPVSPVRQQFYIDKFLSHVRDVLKMAWKSYQRYGPDELFFRVTGVSEQMQMTKGDPNEDFDLSVSFDSQSTDPETVEKRIAQLAGLMPLDANRRINGDALIEVAAAAIDPVLADAILQPSDASMRDLQKDVSDDLTKIYSGMEMNARPNGAQLSLQMIQQYASQPDIAQRLQGDEAFAARLQKYAEQYQFQMQQAQNAQIGRMGTAPAQMGGAPTQDMQ